LKNRAILRRTAQPRGQAESYVALTKSSKVPVSQNSRRWLAVGLILVNIPLGSRAASSSASAASMAQRVGTVQTLAGSGLSGYRDGPALQATFMFPFGVAVARDGTIYVSDIAAQRIRAIRDGAVRTIAGGGDVDRDGLWVNGGFRDGAGRDARFDKPAGLALRPDGSLLVADSSNHCIRIIKDGTVNTFAGNPNIVGDADGPLKDATFSYPRSIAIDSDGDLYVGDPGSGLRKISRSGVVSTIPLPKEFDAAIDFVTVIGEADARRLYVSNHDGLLAINPDGTAAEMYRQTAEGERRFGYPDALLPMAPDTLVFTDARAHTLRLFQARPTPSLPLSEPLVRDVLADAANNGGGFQDGELATAKFDEPRGIARSAAGNLIVADSGNRRIRLVAPGEALRLPIRPSSASSRSHKNWMLGGSVLFFNTLWPQSIPGIVQRALGRSGFEALQYDDSSTANIELGLSEVIRSRPASLVWVLTSKELKTLGPTALTAAFRRLAMQRVPVRICIVPLATELFPLTGQALFALDPAAASDRGSLATLRQIVRRARLKTLDLTSITEHENQRSARGALYATLTPYPTDIGRRLIADAIAGTIVSTPNVQSKFVSPYAVTIGTRDEIYVADIGAQRIFEQRAGKWFVLAGSGALDERMGSVPGGFRNGPAAQARFNRPHGLALATDGGLLVADSQNHCIREIKDGVVSTFAGDPARRVAADGPAGRASFAMPLTIAGDGQGRYYVADYGVGVRMIDRDGSVSTMAIPGMTPDARAVGVAREGGETSLFVVTKGQFFQFDVERKERANNFGGPKELREGGEAPLGFPASFALLNAHQLVFADPASRTVRYFYCTPNEGPLRTASSVRLTSPEWEDPGGWGGGSQSGVKPSSKFQMPTGVGILSNGRVVVADAGARVVAELPPLDRRHPVSQLGDLEINPKYYRIALVSSSYAFDNVSYAQSIGSVIETQLNAKRRALGLDKDVRVVTVRLAAANVTSSADYITEYLANGNIDLVIWMFNVQHVSREFENPNFPRAPEGWEPTVAAQLVRAASALNRAGGRFLLAFQPVAEDASWLEFDWGLDLAPQFTPEWPESYERQVRSAIVRSKVDWADLYPAVRERERSAVRTPLFGTTDGHFSHAGNQVIGAQIALAVMDRPPWLK
jgi:sugar lactone lactonase YvrE